MSAMLAENGWTPEDQQRSEELLRLVDSVTSQMAEEYELSKLTKNRTALNHLKNQWDAINKELSELWKKRGPLE